jgi:hypothetical protein
MCSGWGYWKLFIGHAVGGELNLMVPIGGVEEGASLMCILFYIICIYHS